MSQCDDCKLFLRLEPDSEHGYCRWETNPQIIDMPEWAATAIEEALEDKENFVADYMGTACPCWQKKEEDNG